MRYSEHFFDTPIEHHRILHSFYRYQASSPLSVLMQPILLISIDEAVHYAQEVREGKTKATFANYLKKKQKLETEIIPFILGDGETKRGADLSFGRFEGVMMANILLEAPNLNQSTWRNSVWQHVSIASPQMQNTDMRGVHFFQCHATGEAGPKDCLVLSTFYRRRWANVGRFPVGWTQWPVAIDPNYVHGSPSKSVHLNMKVHRIEVEELQSFAEQLHLDDGERSLHDFILSRNAALQHFKEEQSYHHLVIDISNLDLPAVGITDLSYAKLENLVACQTNFSGCRLDHCDLRYSNLEHANFSEASLQHARCDGSLWHFANFRGVQAQYLQGRGIQAMHACLDQSRWDHADLSGSYWSHSTFLLASGSIAQQALISRGCLWDYCHSRYWHWEQTNGDESTHTHSLWERSPWHHHQSSRSVYLHTQWEECVQQQVKSQHSHYENCRWQSALFSEADAMVSPVDRLNHLDALPRIALTPTDHSDWQHSHFYHCRWQGLSLHHGQWQHSALHHCLIESCNLSQSQWHHARIEHSQWMGRQPSQPSHPEVRVDQMAGKHLRVHASQWQRLGGSRIDLSHSRWAQCRWEESVFDQVRWHGSHWHDCLLDQLHLSQQDFSAMQASKCLIRNTCLDYCRWVLGRWHDTTFDHARLLHAHIQNGHWTESTFRHCTIEHWMIDPPSLLEHAWYADNKTEDARVISWQSVQENDWMMKYPPMIRAGSFLSLIAFYAIAALAGLAIGYRLGDALRRLLPASLNWQLIGASMTSFLMLLMSLGAIWLLHRYRQSVQSEHGPASEAHTKFSIKSEGEAL